jgi:hypothetical protein
MGNIIKKIKGKIEERRSRRAGGEVTGVENRKLMEGLTGDPYKDEKILFPERDPITPPSIVKKSNTEMNIGKKGRELVQYQKPDGSIVITTKRKARRRQRQQERLEKRGMDTRHIPTKF